MSDPRTTAEARSLLFVPGSRPDRFAKAAASGADNLIIDLEDAVAPGSKEAARTAAAQYLQDQPAIVRINAADTSWYAGDLAALAKTAQLAGVVLPKAASVDAVEALVEVLPHGTPVLLLIESAVGMRDAHKLAGVTGVTRLMFGNLDFALDAGITARSAEQSELLYARSTLVVTSRAAGLPGVRSMACIPMCPTPKACTPLCLVRGTSDSRAFCVYTPPRSMWSTRPCGRPKKSWPGPDSCSMWRAMRTPMRSWWMAR